MFRKAEHTESTVCNLKLVAQRYGNHNFGLRIEETGFRASGETASWAKLRKRVAGQQRRRNYPWQRGLDEASPP